MGDLVHFESFNPFTPALISNPKTDFLLRSKLKLSISGELFSSVNREVDREEVKEIQLTGDNRNRLSLPTSNFLHIQQNKATSHSRNGSVHSTQRSSVLSANSSGSNKNKRKDLVMKGILRKMRKEMKEEFISLTDYQNQKRYREDEFYLKCLVEYRNQI